MTDLRLSDLRQILVHRKEQAIEEINQLATRADGTMTKGIEQEIKRLEEAVKRLVFVAREVKTRWLQGE